MNDDSIIKNLKELADRHMHEYSLVNQKIKQIDHVPKARALVGRCFKYRNTYGNVGWWIYKRVVRNKEETVYADEFEDDGSKIEFNYDRANYIGSFGSWAEIKPKEYFTAQKRLLKKLEKKFNRSIVK